MTTRTQSPNLLRLFMVLTLACLAALPARAQTLIRDADVERALSEIAAPVIRASGLSASRIKILVIQDRNYNAFVADSQHIFIHSALLLKVKRVEEIQAVIAHELAHIANSHITRRLGNQQSAGTAIGMGILLGIAAGLAGSPEAGAGIAIGATSSAQRRFFVHTRAEESSADQSGIRYMATARLDTSAMLDVLEIFRGQEVLSASRQSPYVRTHPLSRDRLRAIKGYAAAQKSTSVKRNANSEYWFARMQAKLGGFTRNPSASLRKARRGDTGEIATLTRAIAYHRTPKPKDALREIDRLIAKRPNDAYYHELKGQILLESRQAAAAANAYARASKLNAREPLILAGYGRALLAKGDSASIKRARTVLETARGRDSRDPRMLRDLAVAYAKTGNPGMASVVSAERAALLGRFKDAEIQAKRASGLLKRGSRGWLRAQDVLAAAQRVRKRR